MASIVLGAVGTAVGAATGLPYAAAIGGMFGRNLGRAVDASVLTPARKLRPLQGPRLADLGVQTSTYGKMIPILYGTMRVGGNIIWSMPIQETVTTTTSSAGGMGKGGGGKVTQTATTYSYSVTLAIAICEGPVDEVLRVWADAKQLDMSQYTMRIYKGDESQQPDSLIQSIEGIEKTPAYRGLAYVVFENFPMGDFGNRIPNFTFEVKKKALQHDEEGDLLEEMVTGMVMIPGAGEFVYDTVPEYKIPGVFAGSEWVQQGNRQNLNTHTPLGKPNALVALDQLQEACPNVAWLSVVVCWFGDNMDAGLCTIKPGVEYAAGAVSSPDSWGCAGYTRTTARVITIVDGAPRYGGTPSDASLLRYLAELRGRGYKIALYPMIFMDVDGKQWRGDLTGSAADVAAFFTKANGYNDFISHYAALATGHVDAFIIGSELKGLTRVTDSPGNYPAVNALAGLASGVKSTVGSNVTVTYAADWSEYHHTDGGWYNLDTLWASPDIDVIGIDAYFPLTDSAENIMDAAAVQAGWTSGEGYDWYYSDTGRTVKASLDAPYAWKNIEWFWSNTHVNPDGAATAWVPKSKKIWFTEYGFPSVDCASNQPNVFYDPSSVSSSLPYYSRGRVDFRAQRLGHLATQKQWRHSLIVERMFIWTWDARPYPYWPDLATVWNDSAAWKTGHWVQGKFGISSLAAILMDLCARSGMNAYDIDVSMLSEQVEGFVISGQQTIRDAIETLQLGYFFDAVESDYILKFVPRGGKATLAITEDKLVQYDRQELFTVTRLQEIELPKRINIVYLNRLSNYQTATQYAQREVTASRENQAIDLPLVLSDQIAKNIADITLFSAWIARTGYEFYVPVAYSHIEPSDVIEVMLQNVVHRMRIIATCRSAAGIIRVQAIAEDESTFDFYSPPGDTVSGTLQQSGAPETRMAILDLPAFPGDDSDKGKIRIAANGIASAWQGCAVYRSDDNGANYMRLIDINSPCVMGQAIDALAVGTIAVFDEANSVTVALLGHGQLQSVTELAVLNGANAASLGNEVIQFRDAVLTGEGQYKLTGLLRGRLGTEWAINGHTSGERFVLLDGRLASQTMANNTIGLARQYKAASYGASLGDTQQQDFTYNAVALKPYSPVHVSALRDLGGNLSLSWVRRARLNAEWKDNSDVALNESIEAYEVDIINGSNVVRTLSGIATPTASYPAASQVADFGSVQASVDVRIYQLSSLVGRGYPAAATV